MGTSVETVGSPSLETFAGELFGDLPVADESTPSGAPAPSTPSASESPAAPEVPAPAPAEVPSTPSASEPPSTPPAAAPPPPSEPPAVPAADDPAARLASAPALTYTVDGATKTYDGIKVMGEDGAVIDPAALPDLQRRLGERDHLVAANAQLYQRTRQFDALSHTSTVGGTPQDFRGMDAFRQLKADYATTFAGAAELYAKLHDPAFVQALAIANLSPDQGGNPEQAKALLKQVYDRANFAGEKAAYDARLQLDRTVAQGTAEVADKAQIEETFASVLADFRKTFPHLTAADMQEGEQHFRELGSVIARQATPQEAQQYGLKVGQWFIDSPKMNGWFKGRDALRQEMAKTVVTTSAAATQNAARLAQAVSPTPPAATPPKAPTRPKQTDTRAADADAGWDLMERLSSARVGTSASA